MRRKTEKGGGKRNTEVLGNETRFPGRDLPRERERGFLDFSGIAIGIR
jgi:hypothetical protein